MPKPGTRPNVKKARSSAASQMPRPVSADLHDVDSLRDASNASPCLKRRSAPLPPKLGVKKRKPRPSSVISAANQRVRAVVSQQSDILPAGNALSNHLDHVHVNPAAAGEVREGGYGKVPVEAESKRKGLRHFAVRVSRKVEQKDVTTYNEVADELVAEETLLRKSELANGGQVALNLQKKLEKTGSLVDEKNIRRRVYDSLNVLMAMGIIEKEKKLISWRGLHNAYSARQSDEIVGLKTAIQEKRRQIEEKKRVLQGIQDQFLRTSAIIERNKEEVRSSGVDPDLVVHAHELPVHHYYPDRLGLPFVIIAAPRDTSIELEMDKSREDICFTFNSSFQILDDRETLKRMPFVTADRSYNPFTELERLSHQLITSPDRLQQR